VNNELSYCNVAFGQANLEKRRKLKRRQEPKQEGDVTSILREPTRTKRTQTKTTGTSNLLTKRSF